MSSSCSSSPFPGFFWIPWVAQVPAWLPAVWPPIYLFLPEVSLMTWLQSFFENLIKIVKQLNTFIWIYDVLQLAQLKWTFWSSNNYFRYSCWAIVMKTEINWIPSWQKLLCSCCIWKFPFWQSVYNFWKILKHDEWYSAIQMEQEVVSLYYQEYRTWGSLRIHGTFMDWSCVLTLFWFYFNFLIFL